MKGFNTGDGYMGMVDGEYMPFRADSLVRRKPSAKPQNVN